jgi:phospholipase/carboxylesterase
MAVLEDLPQADLTGLSVLTLTGARDPYGPHAPRLNDWLSRQGADLDARVVQAGHDLTADDLAAAADWMTEADHG